MTAAVLPPSTRVGRLYVTDAELGIEGVVERIDEMQVELDQLRARVAGSITWPAAAYTDPFAAVPFHPGVKAPFTDVDRTISMMFPSGPVVWSSHRSEP